VDIPPARRLFHDRHSREGGNPANTRGSAEKSHAAADAAQDWIPAFAGMTNENSIADTPTPLTQGAALSDYFLI
jgi:hypothetical protein